MILSLREQQTIDAMGDVTCQLLDAEGIDHFWPDLADLLMKIPHVWKNETLESIHQRAMTTQLQVWAVGRQPRAEMFLFTQIAVHPGRKYLEVTFAAGVGLLKIAGPAVDAALEYFAHSQGCSEIIVVGRGGWQKILRDWGFKRTAVVLSRPVTDRSTQ